MAGIKSEGGIASSKGPVTADDVAAEAGVSRWTVNRAFRREASISEKSRKKVLAVAEKLGYAPDLLASSLASDRSNLVALLVDDFSNPHKLVMLEYLTKGLRQSGWDALLVNMIDQDDASRALRHASQRRVDASILIGLQFDDEVVEAALDAKRVKKLIVFARSSDNPDTINVCCDDAVAITQIAQYVSGKGYRRPMFLAGPNTLSAHVQRKEIFERYWTQTHGVAPELTGVSAYDPNLAFDTVYEVLKDRKQSELPDVIVCENDALALGTIDAIKHRLKLRVPDDIAVTGFDDVPLAMSPNYELTTYRQPLDAMVARVIDILDNSQTDEDISALTGDLVIRQSA